MLRSGSPESAPRSRDDLAKRGHESDCELGSGENSRGAMLGPIVEIFFDADACDNW